MSNTISISNTFYSVAKKALAHIAASEGSLRLGPERTYDLALVPLCLELLQRRFCARWYFEVDLVLLPPLISIEIEASASMTRR